MSKINNINDIKGIHVHWSENNHINTTLGCDEWGDIEKPVDVFAFSMMVELASKEVKSGYDKTCLTVTMKDGTKWADDMKFYLTAKEDCLLKLLNKGA